MTTPANSALLVLDVQPAFLPASDSFVPAVDRAIAHARRRGIPVHVAGRPLVSDFTLLALVERRPESVAPRSRRD